MQKTSETCYATHILHGKNIFDFNSYFKMFSNLIITRCKLCFKFYKKKELDFFVKTQKQATTNGRKFNKSISTLGLFLA